MKGEGDKEKGKGYQELPAVKGQGTVKGNKRKGSLSGKDGLQCAREVIPSERLDVRGQRLMIEAERSALEAEVGALQ